MVGDVVGALATDETAAAHVAHGVHGRSGHLTLLPDPGQQCVGRLATEGVGMPWPDSDPRPAGGREEVEGVTGVVLRADVVLVPMIRDSSATNALNG